MVVCSDVTCNFEADARLSMPFLKFRVTTIFDVKIFHKLVSFMPSHARAVEDS